MKPNSLILKSLYSLSILLFLNLTVQAQTTLSLGDIAITGYNSDTPDGFSFVLLKDVDANTQVSFTDRGWFASGGFRNTFNGNSVEGVVTVTFSAAQTCGTEFSLINNGSWTINAGSGASASSTGSLALSTGGDQLFAFQGTTTSPTLITGIQANGDWDSDATSSNTSAKPANFITGTNSLFIGVDGTSSDEQDNGKYDCSVTGTDEAAIRSAVNDVSKWATSNTTVYDLTQLCGFSCGVVCTDPTAPTLSGTTTINVGQSTTLSVTGGNLNDGDNWVWYAGSGCSGTPIGTGASINVSPAFTTQYYARGEGTGDCNVFGPCSSAVTVTVNNPSAETLAAGDIAFVGLNSNGGSEADEFSFIILRDIAIGTDINFTDCGWDDGSGSFVCLGSSATADNGFFTWRATGALTCGTIVTISTFQGSTTPTANTGSIQGANMVLSNIGDQVFAYQGNFASPFFIAGIHYNVTGGTTAANWDGDVTDGTMSELPNGLANGVNAVWLYTPGPTEQDNFSIICDSIGNGTVNASILRDKINNDLDNWTYTNSVPFTLPPACSFTVDCSAPVCVDPTLPSFIGGGSGYCLSELPITLAFDDVNDADLGDATQWVWYEGGCGSGSPVGTGTSIQVSPIVPTTYFVRGEGGCVTPGACASVSVVISGCGTNLSVGDLAFTGVNSNSPDGFSFVLLRDIVSGTEINFTDCGWDDTNGFDCSFAGDNGYFTWRSTSAMTCGEEVVINTNDGTSTPTPSTGIVFGSNMSLNIGGDQIFAFQNGLSSPNLKAGIHYNVTGGTTASNWDGGVTNGSTSALPNALTNGVNAVWVYAPGPVERDNMIVNCSAFSGVSGDDDIRLAINDVNNWLTQDGTPYTLPANCGFSCCQNAEVTTLTSSDNDVCPGTMVTLTVGGSLNDAANWQWYSGSCGGTSEGTGSSIQVSVNSTTTYYVRGEGNCTGTSALCEMITVNIESTPPSLSCPGNQTLGLDANCQASLPDYTGMGAVSDNCDNNPSISQSPTSGTTINGITTTIVTLTATDASGNSSTCTFSVDTEDISVPSLTCPGTQTGSVDELCNFEVPDYTGLATASDNCDATPTVTQSPAPGNTFNGAGNTVIQLTATDDSGNSSTCSFTLTLLDEIPPTIDNCPTSFSDAVLDANCENALPDYTGTITISDNCDAAPTVSQNPAPSTIITGVQSVPVTLTVTDASGNSSTCSFSINHVDNAAPDLACPGNITSFYDENCGYELLDYSNLVTLNDNCDPAPSLAQMPGAGTTVNGNTTIVFVATDASGNSSTCSFNIELSDTTPPSINCPGDQSLTTDANCQATLPDYTALATTSDNCTASPTVSQSPIPGTTINTTTIITLTATDDTGNSSTCTFNVSLIDDTPPVVDCSSIVTDRDNDSGQCSFNMPGTGFDPIVSDNCPGVSVLNNYNNTASLAGETFPVGTTTVVWIATDGAGNSAACTIDIVISDAEAPMIDCSGVNGNRSADAGQCSFTMPGTGFDATASDNCPDGFTLVNDYNNGNSLAGETFPVGMTTVTWTASDAAGNSATCSVDIVITDDEAPTIDCSGIDTDRSNDPGQCSFTMPGTGFDPIFSDNCPGAMASNNYNNSNSLAGETFPVGTTPVQWTVTDDAGNTNSCIINIVITDDEDPNAVCINNTVTLSGDGTYQLQADDVLDLNLSGDNCGFFDVKSINPDMVDCSNENMTLPVQVTVEDGSGNSADCTAMITVVQGTDLPSGWTHDDIGAATGDATFKPCDGEEGVWTVSSNGPSFGPADKLHFAWTELCGNGEIIARVTGVTNLGWAGVMMRENSTAGSRTVRLKTNGSNFVRREFRTTPNGFLTSNQLFRTGQLWLRIVKNGDFYIGYTSFNSLQWNFAFQIYNPMGECVQVGLMAEGINDTSTSVATFENVTINSGNIFLNLPEGFDVNPELADVPLSFELFPNPAGELVNIDLKNFQEEEVMISLMNESGQILERRKRATGAADTFSWDLRSYSSGYHILMLERSNGEVHCKPLIIQKR